MKALAIALTLLIPAAASAATHTVNANDDLDDGVCDGTHCSLREAIGAADVGDTVNFDLGADGVIELDTHLFIQTDELTIDGLDCASCVPQPVAHSGGTSGGLSTTPAVGITAATSSPVGSHRGLYVVADNVTVRGLAVYDFSGGGVSNASNVGMTLEHSWIGSDLNGTVVGNGGFGVTLGSGDTLGPGNWIVGSGTGGVFAAGTAAGMTIVGNLVGTTLDATALAPASTWGPQPATIIGLQLGGSAVAA